MKNQLRNLLVQSSPILAFIAEAAQKPAPLRGKFYASVKLTPRKNPVILALSYLLQDFGFDRKIVLSDPEAPYYLSASKLFHNSTPAAHCYCGYQFGTWAGQLGDGRATTLGFARTLNGELLQIQSKGSGQTQFSRNADGNAVLRSSIRQFLASEFMHSLGIPTTRALSLVGTDDLAIRDPLYDSHIVEQRCAVVIRSSPTFIRFGSFQVCNSQEGRNGPSFGLANSLIPLLADHVIGHYFHHLKQLQGSKRYVQFYRQVVRRTAKLVALWQVYGFVHGVLNTDNMSILGLTIDYGPYCFMDRFDSRTVSNHSDKEGRYSYQNQPEVCRFNLDKLANALDPVHPSAKLKEVLSEEFDSTFSREYRRAGCLRLGLQDIQDNSYIVIKFFQSLEKTGCRFNESFQQVLQFRQDQDDQRLIQGLSELSAPMFMYIQSRTPRFSDEHLQRFRLLAKDQRMAARFGLTQSFLQKVETQLGDFKRLVESEYRPAKVWEEWADLYKGGQWKKNVEEAKQANPKKNLCNYILRNIIDAQEQHVGATQALLDFVMGKGDWREEWQGRREEQVCVSCSS